MTLTTSRPISVDVYHKMTAEGRFAPDALVVRRYHIGEEPEKAKAEDVYILVEVSDSTLAYDLREKLPRYAAAVVPEVWIIDVNDNYLTQYHAPDGETYTVSSVLHRTDTIKTTLGVAIEAARILL